MSAASYKWSRQSNINCCSRSTYTLTRDRLSKSSTRCRFLIGIQLRMRRQRQSTSACKGMFFDDATKLMLDELRLHPVVVRFRKNFHVFSNATTTVYTSFQKFSSANDGKRAENGSSAHCRPASATLQKVDFLCRKMAVQWLHLHCSGQAGTHDPANRHKI